MLKQRNLLHLNGSPITYQELGDLIGIHVNTVSRWANRGFSAEGIIRAFTYLDVKERSILFHGHDLNRKYKVHGVLMTMPEAAEATGYSVPEVGRMLRKFGELPSGFTKKSMEELYELERSIAKGLVGPTSPGDE